MPETRGKTEKIEKEGVEIDLGIGKLSFGGLFKGLEDLIGLASDLAEKGEEIRREGEIKGLPKDAKGVYGFSIRTLGGRPVVESFGNIKETPKGPVVEEVREPMVDVFDEKEHILIVAEMPGVEKNNIHIDIEGDALLLKAENTGRKYKKEVPLPSAVDRASLVSSYKNIPREALVQYLFAHQAVIEEIVKDRTAVPIKVGTTAVTDKDAGEILELGYARFKEAVDGMKDKTEIEMMARWNDLDPVLKEIGNKAEIRRFKEGIKTGGQSNFQALAVELGRMVKTALNEENSRVRDEILNVLDEHAVEFRLHDPLDERMIMNAAFLIPENPPSPPFAKGGDHLSPPSPPLEKGEMGGFWDEIEKTIEMYRERIDFKIIGPLPPYSFSTLEITRVGAGEVSEAMAVMGVDGNAGKTGVKDAYRRLLQKYHPDKNHDDPEAQRQFEKIRVAYKTLMDCHTFAGGKDAVMVRVV
ncbi:MAG: GvpL/GvpF family gas vesicle protein [Deltaproteobacteria bacterium]|nr:GvpL/GvpF family gas vesicle protein [Deltaproteobacteria bacterium]